MRACGVVFFGAALLLVAACSDDSTATDGGRDAATDGVVASDGETPLDGTRGDTVGPASDGGGPDAAPLPARCNGSVISKAPPATGLPSTPALKPARGFSLKLIARVPRARQLAQLPNGDLLVGTNGSSVYLVPAADRDKGAGKPVVFTTINDEPVQGVAFVGATCTVYVASQHGIYSIPYRDGQTSGTAKKPIARVRTGGTVGRDVHTSTSVVFGGGTLYASVGSSCDACTETDPTRATIQRMRPDGTKMTTRARRFRNAIALAINPATGTLWAGGAGQDGLTLGHPYEFFDAVGLHSGVADYGWPACEENHHAYISGADCSKTVAPLIELPAYSTIIGAVFYPAKQGGAHAFPAGYRGGVFLAVHGAWHKSNGKYYSPPRVAYVAMRGDTPVTPVDWSDPSKQWKEFIGGFQLADGVTRIARATGITVARDGSLLLADDKNGYVYRVRPKP